MRAEIEALKARQKAVEDLQTDRNVPVHLLNELVKHTPEGVYLTSIKQSGDVVSVNGVAQTNERVSELLRNTAYNVDMARAARADRDQGSDGQTANRNSAAVRFLDAGDAQARRRGRCRRSAPGRAARRPAVSRSPEGRHGNQEQVPQCRSRSTSVRAGGIAVSRSQPETNRASGRCCRSWRLRSRWRPRCVVFGWFAGDVRRNSTNSKPSATRSRR